MSIGEIHKRYLNSDLEFAHEAGPKIPHDIFTKMFADKLKWMMARRLINVALSGE
jgi:hypothetical protein